MEPLERRVDVGRKAVLQQAPKVTKLLNLRPVRPDRYGGVAGIAPSLGRTRCHADQNSDLLVGQAELRPDPVHDVCGGLTLNAASRRGQAGSHRVSIGQSIMGDIKHDTSYDVNYDKYDEPARWGLSKFRRSGSIALSLHHLRTIRSVTPSPP